MSGDEREEGKSDAPAGREATYLPENTMPHDVIVSLGNCFMQFTKTTVLV